MFVGEEVCQADLASVLNLAGPASLTAGQVDLVGRCHRDACWWIMGAMTARGYTPDQVQAWDAGPSYERSIALWGALTGGGAAVDDRFVRSLDWRGRLKRVIITIGGHAAGPAALTSTPRTCAPRGWYALPSTPHPIA